VNYCKSCFCSPRLFFLMLPLFLYCQSASSGQIFESYAYLLQGSYRSGKTGKCQGICVVREMSGKNIIFEKSGKVREHDLGLCRLQTADNCDFFASPNIEKQADLRLTLNVQKLDIFELQGGSPPDASIVCLLLY